MPPLTKTGAMPKQEEGRGTANGYMYIQVGGGGMGLPSQTKNKLITKTERGEGVMGKNLWNVGSFSEKTPLAMKSNGLVRSVAIFTDIYTAHSCNTIGSPVPYPI